MKLKRVGKKVNIRPLNRIDSNVKKENFTKIVANYDKKRALGTFIELGIFSKKGDLVGELSLMNISRGLFQNCYLGYRIFNNYWGMGFGKETVNGLILDSMLPSAKIMGLSVIQK